MSEYKSGKGPVISYTDDSAMTLTMAQSLVGCQKFDHLDMAKRYFNKLSENEVFIIDMPFMIRGIIIMCIIFMAIHFLGVHVLETHV